MIITDTEQDFLSWWHTMFFYSENKKHVRIRFSLSSLERHSSHQSVARRDCKDLYKENILQKLIKWTTGPCKWNKRNRYPKKSIMWEFLVPGSASMACFDFGFRHFSIMVLYRKLTSACKSQGQSFELLWGGWVGKGLLNTSLYFEHLPPSVLENYFFCVERTRKEEVINRGKVFLKKNKIRKLYY